MERDVIKVWNTASEHRIQCTVLLQHVSVGEKWTQAPENEKKKLSTWMAVFR